MIKFFLIFLFLICFIISIYKLVSKFVSLKKPKSLGIVCSHYKENLDWILEVLDNYSNITNITIYDCGINDISHINGNPKVKINQKVKERTLYNYYFKYIYDNYDNLPEYILFCHSHNVDWHQKLTLNTIINYLNKLQDKFEYINTSDKVYSDWYTANKFLNKHVNKVLLEHPIFFKEYFGKEIDESPLLVMDINAGQCCVQKKRILRLPKKAWEYLYKITLFKNHHEDYDFGIEGLFHIIMGEKAIRPFIKLHFDELKVENKGGRNELELLNSLNS